LFSLYFRYYTQNFFVTRLIINKINKVQWVDFNLENVLVSLHSLKTMGLGPFGASAPLCLRNGELLGHSPMHNPKYWHVIHNFDQLCLDWKFLDLSAAEIFEYISALSMYIGLLNYIS
jgi:hypothetical protein